LNPLILQSSRAALTLKSEKNDLLLKQQNSLVLQSKSNSLKLQTGSPNLLLQSRDNSLALISESQTMTLTTAGAVFVIGSYGGTITVDYDEVFPLTIFTVPSTQSLDRIGVRVTEAFKSDATLKIGLVSDDDKFFEIGDTDLTATDILFEKDFDTDGPLSLRLVINPGTMPTAGQVKIQISTTKKGQ
jgi:hypothetical protein